METIQLELITTNGEPCGLRLVGSNDGGRVILRATLPGSGREVDILEVSHNGITLYDGSEIDGIESASIVDAHGCTWAGLAVQFDGTSVYFV